jgi:hypothetical protein
MNSSLTFILNDSLGLRSVYGVGLDLLSEGSAGTTHAARGSVAKTPYSNISCLAVIMGETGWTGRNTGWDGKAVIRGFFDVLRGITMAIWGIRPRFEIRADNGRVFL